MKKEKYVIDRIEEGIIVLLSCEDDTQIEVPAEKFSDNLSESDIVYVSFKDGEITDIVADKEETKNKKAEMKKKFQSLFDDK